MTMYERFNKRIPGSAINKVLATFANDTTLVEWGNAKPTAKETTSQRMLVEFIMWGGYVSPTNLLDIREKEMQGKLPRDGIRADLRDFRDNYIMAVCKGCDHLLETPAKFGEMKTCPNCGGETLAPKSRTKWPVTVESFFTNVLGPASKSLGKGELNKESDDTLKRKYGVTLETVDNMARVADTKEKAFLYINIQTGMDSADIQKYFLSSQDIELLDNPDRDVWVMHHLPRRKETGRGGKEYKNALCGEGLDAYRAYMRKEGLTVGSPLLKGKQGQPLEGQMMTIYLSNLKKKSGLDVKDLRLDLKTLRAFAFTALSSAEGVMCAGGEFGKFCTGKKVDNSIHTYLLAHDNEILAGYRSVMHKLNPSMAKYQETLDLKDIVAEQGRAIIKIQGQLESMQNQISAYINGKPGLAQEFKIAADNPENSLCDNKTCEHYGKPLVKGTDGLLTCPSTLHDQKTPGGGAPGSSYSNMTWGL